MRMLSIKTTPLIGPLSLEKHVGRTSKLLL